MFIAGFTNKKDIDIKQEFGDQFSYADESGQKRKFMSVSEFGPLFGATDPQVHRNLPYAESKNKRQTVDVCVPAEGKVHPIVFWIHGGGWQEAGKSKVQNTPKASDEASQSSW